MSLHDVVKSTYKVKAWLEKAEREGLNLKHPMQEPLPIDIVMEKVGKIEKKMAEQKKKKAKPFNILEQPDDKYDFSYKPESKRSSRRARSKNESININKLEEVSQPSRSKSLPKSFQEPSVLDAYEDQKKIFELDDYIHEDDVDAPLTVFKSQPIKLSEAKSRLQPPAQRPYNKRKLYDHIGAKVDSSRKVILDPIGWQQMPATLTNVLYKGKKKTKSKNHGTKSTANVFNPTLFIQQDPIPKENRESSEDPKRVGFTLTNSQTGINIEESEEAFDQKMGAAKNPSALLHPKTKNNDSVLPLIKYLEDRKHKKAPAPIGAVKEDVTLQDRAFEKLRERILEEDRQITVNKEIQAKKLQKDLIKNPWLNKKQKQEVPREPEKPRITDDNRGKSKSKEKVKSSQEPSKVKSKTSHPAYKKPKVRLQPAAADSAGSIAQEHRKLANAWPSPYKQHATLPGALELDKYNLLKNPKLYSKKSRVVIVPKPADLVAQYFAKHLQLERDANPELYQSFGSDERSKRPVIPGFTRDAEPRWASQTGRNHMGFNERDFVLKMSNRIPHEQTAYPNITLKEAKEILLMEPSITKGRLSAVMKLINAHNKK